MCVFEIDDWVVGDHALNGGRVHAPLANGSAKGVLREGVDLEGHWFSYLYVADVGFVGLGVDPHFREVLGDGEDCGGLQRCGDGLADVDVARHDSAIDGRTNDRVIQICLRYSYGSILLTDLGFRLRDVRGGGTYGRICG